MGRYHHDISKQFLLTQIIEEELLAQASILESLNTTLYQTQMELQREVSPGWNGVGSSWEDPRLLCSSAIQLLFGKDSY